MHSRRGSVGRAMRWSLVAALPLCAAITTGGESPVNAVVEWELVDEPVSLNMRGVSPHAEKVTGGDRVWRSDGPQGTVVSLCTDAGVCTSETFSIGGGPVNDFSVAQTSGGLRAYFKRVDPPSNTQAVYSAPCLTPDCLSVGTTTLASDGMKVGREQKAWGVPDPVRMPDGRIRIYIVESPVVGKCLEKIASYTSTDATGITFAKDPGWRLEGGYVDTEVLRAKDGEWLMILADIACTASNNQKLFVSSSTDGLTWSQPQVLTGPGEFKFDPTGYETGTNVFRVYYAAGNFDSSVIKRAVLRIKAAPAGGVGITTTPNVTTPAKKTKTITCVKGKTVRKVTGTSCPKGFSRK